MLYNKLIKIKNAHLEKVLKFFKKCTDQCKISRNYGFECWQDSDQISKGYSTIISKVIIAFLKHSELCNSKTVWLDK